MEATPTGAVHSWWVLCTSLYRLGWWNNLQQGKDITHHHHVLVASFFASSLNDVCCQPPEVVYCAHGGMHCAHGGGMHGCSWRGTLSQRTGPKPLINASWWVWLAPWNSPVDVIEEYFDSHCTYQQIPQHLGEWWQW